jgi:hypothetical protein
MSDIKGVKSTKEKRVSEGKPGTRGKRPKPLSKEERLEIIRQIAEDRGMLRHSIEQ